MIRWLHSAIEYAVVLVGLLTYLIVLVAVGGLPAARKSRVVWWAVEECDRLHQETFGE